VNIFIRADMEGATGVVSFDQTEPGKPEYDYGRRMLASDVNAAVAGCFDGAGAGRVVVYDMHCDGRNIPLDRFDPRGEMICGKPHVSQDFLRQFNALMLVGLHGKAGGGTLLAHSYELDTIDIRLNGTSVGEIGIEAAIAGECGLPLVFVAADSAGCVEARALVPEVHTAQVKVSLAPSSALCVAAEKTCELIRSGAAEAARDAQNIRPFSLAPFECLEVDLPTPGPINPRRLEEASNVQLKGRTLSIAGETLFEAWHTYRSLRKAPDAE